MAALTTNEIDKQLTQRRIDIEDIQVTIMQLQNKLNTLNNSIKDLSASSTNTDNTNNSKQQTFLGIVKFLAAATFVKLASFVSGLVTPLIYPPSDSTTALKVTKADGSTAILILDTTNGRFGIGGTPVAQPLEVVADTTGFSMNIRGRASDNLSKIKFTDNAGTTIGGVITGLGSSAFLQDAAGNILIQWTANTLGFFNGTAAAKQTLNAYTTNNQSGAYTGIATGVAGTPYAAVSDLNTLRVAYENLRSSYDDIRTKLRTSTIVG